MSDQWTSVLWDMVDGPMPRGVLGLGDPDLHVIAGQTVMFLGGFSTTFRNRLYRAELDPGADPRTGPWRFPTDRRGRAVPLLSDPPRGAWDAGGMHTPCYVPGHGSQPSRIYYAGRANGRHYGPGSGYAIGALELVGGDWRRREAPVLTGEGVRASVLEPLVVLDEGRYVMWFQATAHRDGPGEQPDFELRAVESADGLTWSTPRTFTSTAEGMYDNAVVRTGAGWLMLLARGSNLHGARHFPPQGLWTTSASRLSSRREDWSPLRRALDTDRAGTPAWLGRGVFGPSALPYEAAGDGPVVFLTGTRAAARWPVLLLRRLVSGRRPVVPAPYFFAVGTVDLRSAG